MRKVEYLEDLKEGEFVYLIRKDGYKEIVVKIDSDELGFKGRFAISQYPTSGSVVYISNKDWERNYLHKYVVSGESSWGKEYTEI